MPPWLSTPQFRITVGSTTYTNDEALTIEVTRPENNISSCVLTLNDYQSKNYVGIFDLNTAVTVDIRYGSDSWTTIFSGHVFDLRPTTSINGELLTASCWGQEYGLHTTHCKTSYGTESQRNHSITTAQGIIQDIITNWINDSLDGGVATNWALDNTDVENTHAGCAVTYLSSQYLNNFGLINRVCDIVNAWASQQGPPREPGIHWYCDTSDHLRVKEIDADSTDGLWTKWWKGSEQTLTVKQDMILTDFHKTMDGYTNDVILSTAFRLPAEDYWTETHSGDWGTSNCAGTNSATRVVGADSLKMEPTDFNAVYSFYWPSTQTAAWDLTKIGSPKSPAYLTFYARQDSGGGNQLSNVVLVTNANTGSGPYGGLAMCDGITDEWVTVSLPIGPYHHYFIDDNKREWVTGFGGFVNPVTWSNVNYILFLCAAPLADNKGVYIDDIHFSGNIVRRAYDSDQFAAYYDRQKFIRNDTAISDVLIATTDSGTAARLACDELYRGMSTPIVGVIQIPMAVDMLPGQQLHVKACQQASGSYRIDKDFRIFELKHLISTAGCFTILNLTDDLNNSRAIGAPTIASVMQEYLGALGHAEAKDLKGGAVDNLIEVLANNY